MRVVTGLVLLFLTIGAAAQPSFGGRAGLAVANINGLPGADTQVAESPRLGPTVAAFARVPVASGFDIQPEVGYVPRGVRRELDPAVLTRGGSPVAEVVRVSYVDVAALGRIRLPGGPSADAGVVLGPALSRKVGEDVTSEYADGSEVALAGDFLTNTDVGLVIGVDVGSGPFLVDVRYTFGLTNVYEGEGINPTGGIREQDLKHSVFAAAFGIRLGGG